MGNGCRKRLYAQKPGRNFFSFRGTWSKMTFLSSDHQPAFAALSSLRYFMPKSHLLRYFTLFSSELPNDSVESTRNRTTLQCDHLRNIVHVPSPTRRTKMETRASQEQDTATGNQPRKSPFRNMPLFFPIRTRILNPEKETLVDEFINTRLCQTRAFY